MGSEKKIDISAPKREDFVSDEAYMRVCNQIEVLTLAAKPELLSA